MKKPSIIDADETIGECDMNYDYELINYQITKNTNQTPLYRTESVIDLERKSKDFMKRKLDNIN